MWGVWARESAAGADEPAAAAVEPAHARPAQPEGLRDLPFAQALVVMQLVEIAKAGRQLIDSGMKEVFELDIGPGRQNWRTDGQAILRPATDSDPHQIHGFV